MVSIFLMLVLGDAIFVILKLAAYPSSYIEPTSLFPFAETSGE